MEEGMIRAIETLVLFVAFVAFALWVWSPGQKARFEEAAMLPFVDGDDDVATASGGPVRNGGKRHE